MDKLINEHTYEYVNEVVKFMVSDLESSFRLKAIKLNWNLRITSSRGGMNKEGPGINMAMYQLRDNEGYGVVKRMHEYPSFDKDPVIGGLYYLTESDSLSLKGKCVLVHELAHALQLSRSYAKKIRVKPHGEEFKEIYAILRNKFINPFINHSLQKVYEDGLPKSIFNQVYPKAAASNSKI